MYEIKKQPEDFVVEEITRKGNILSIDENYFFDDKSSGRELICVLIKKNWDTLLALKKISKRLHISRNRVGFAGTKDKKAVTSQLISLSGVKKEEIEGIKIKDIQLKPLYYSNERISLGFLKGNHFKIKVYSDKEPREVRVIPNYFGVQRFGKTRPITHLVGKKIIEGKPEEAVMVYLAKTFEGEKEETRKAREKLRKERDFKEALDYFPSYLKYERSLIEHLVEYPTDFIGALRILPKTLKLMFVHAYQSYLFNKMLDYAVKYKIKVNELPLVGYGSKLNEWQKAILKKEGVALSDFHVKFLPELSAEGLMRKAFIELNDLKVTREKEEEYTLEFSLPKGTYATTVIDFLFNV